MSIYDVGQTVGHGWAVFFCRFVGCIFEIWAYFVHGAFVDEVRPDCIAWGFNQTKQFTL